MPLTYIEKIGGEYLAMTTCGELLDKLSHHVLITLDGEVWKIHVPTQGHVCEGTCQKLAFERVCGSNDSHASIKSCGMLHGVALPVEGGEMWWFEIFWDGSALDFG